VTHGTEEQGDAEHSHDHTKNGRHYARYGIGIDVPMLEPRHPQRFDDHECRQCHKQYGGDEVGPGHFFASRTFVFQRCLHRCHGRTSLCLCSELVLWNAKHRHAESGVPESSILLENSAGHPFAEGVRYPTVRLRS